MDTLPKVFDQEITTSLFNGFI
jgi:hypothetical protein